ncbi:glycosyltransferase [Vibrio sp. SM6]|uniref:Glycosyltransferase n=1 Tax=Vibrio agarilyticus TaxID=2726741 RepID=A0A7X8YFX5_9VIBR|nr:MJ1255/VC2487 family glycosyltransferase [Vibrio agarilyticus]NLS12368.1 glycosyltransferase [Vibrio agarilyticus]
MKVLYGVQGTGNGHIARARAMCSALKKRGVEVDYLFSGRDESNYFAMEEFGAYRTCKGLSFVTEKGKVSYSKTAAAVRPWRLMRDIQTLDLSPYTLILNDFEPVSAWAAKRQGKTTISISHQNAFRHNVPLRGANWFDKQMIQHFAPATHHIGLHWYHFEQPLLPPIIATLPVEAELESFILVYLPFEACADIGHWLRQVPNQHFICYHPEVREPYRSNNIEFRPPSRHGFQRALKQCLGVVANGGFELPSEALSLGKKILLKPLKGQFEQLSNAATLDALGLATMMEELDLTILGDWLQEPAAERVGYPDVAGAICDWLLQGAWHDQKNLASHLWSQVNFPTYVSNFANEY